MNPSYVEHFTHFKFKVRRLKRFYETLFEKKIEIEYAIIEVNNIVKLSAL